VIEARANDMIPFRANASLGPGETLRIEIVLRAVDTPNAETSPDHTLAYAVGGAGVVGLAVGTVAGIVAWRKNASSTDVCPNDGACRDASARSDNHAAHDWAVVSTVGFVAGGVLAAAGVVLYLAAPSTKAAAMLTPRGMTW
jgi:hypothetical protein